VLGYIELAVHILSSDLKKDFKAGVKMEDKDVFSIGRWKQTEVVHECFDINGFKTWGIKYMCESCRFKTIAIEGHFTQYNFCPNCGAKMEE
jgi:predicted RNA-binding Zn-ribbon protein involved in translation (DUF1610 family)